MPRKPRIEFAGAFYHILSRGDRGEPIYLDADDCRMFLATVAELCDRTGFLLHAYVLMLKQSHSRKQGLVWLIKGHCVVPDEWILKRLEMGHRSNISRAISAFRSPKDYERIALKQKLHICTD